MKRHFTILSIAALLVSLFTAIHAEHRPSPRQTHTECLTPEGISSFLGFLLYNFNRYHILVNMCDYVKCANNAICRSTNTSRCFECICQPGFTGTMCQQRENITDIINPCSSVTCYNGGSCLILNNEAFCVCPWGVTGHQCEQVTSTNPCDSYPCFNGGSCIAQNGRLECICPPNTSGYQCEYMNISISSNSSGIADNSTFYPCNNFTCYNGGSCVILNNEAFCVCPWGATGDQCEQVTSTNPCDSYPCFNNGMCIAQNGRLECVCPPNTSGYQCEYISVSNNNTNVDPCESMTCYNNGTCYTYGNESFCACQLDITGRYCEEILALNPCSSSPCMSGGTCISGNGTYQCICPADRAGELCERYSALHPCASSPCLNNGYCVGVSNDTDFFCFCGYDRTGRFCEQELIYDPCGSSPCENNGSCIITNNTYICQCPPGTSGYNCELSDSLDLCSFSPCDNGGTCYSIGKNGIKCICPFNTTGRYCEQNFGEAHNQTTPCFSSPCANNGSCIDLNDSYMCICPDNVTGTNCEINYQPSEEKMSCGDCCSSSYPIHRAIQILDNELRLRPILNPNHATGFDELTHFFNIINGLFQQSALTLGLSTNRLATLLHLTELNVGVNLQMSQQKLTNTTLYSSLPNGVIKLHTLDKNLMCGINHRWTPSLTTTIRCGTKPQQQHLWSHVEYRCPVGSYEFTGEYTTQQQSSGIRFRCLSCLYHHVNFQVDGGLDLKITAKDKLADIALRLKRSSDSLVFKCNLYHPLENYLISIQRSINTNLTVGLLIEKCVDDDRHQHMKSSFASQWDLNTVGLRINTLINTQYECGLSLTYQLRHFPLVLQAFTGYSWTREKYKCGIGLQLLI
ncbi:unnamed protein product [Adineta ricciae]|uniref:EGF-like domain-containing protein n=1 Tax=Adineta ricciae TaxID=249248 RepID=A0A814ERS6_ADIRI|nr:unnamed protein product [Adineta ricciae]